MKRSAQKKDFSGTVVPKCFVVHVVPTKILRIQIVSDLKNSFSNQKFTLNLISLYGIWKNSLQLIINVSESS